MSDHNHSTLMATPLPTDSLSLDPEGRGISRRDLLGGFSSTFASAMALAGGLGASVSVAADNPSVKVEDGVIKMITLLHRKPGMTREQFIERYEGVHRKIGEKYLKEYAVRYVRRYTRPAGPERVGDVELPADVVMEIWFPNQATFETCMASLMTEEAQAEIVADELQMFDRSRMVSFMVEEYESNLKMA